MRARIKLRFDRLLLFCDFLSFSLICSYRGKGCQGTIDYGLVLNHASYGKAAIVFACCQ